MDRYDYFEAVREDATNAIIERVNWEGMEYLEDKENIYDDLWIDDSVTGNASGSYTFSTWQAEENLCHNLDLLGEALSEFGCDPDYMAKHGAEACDVTIRCWALGQVLDEAIEAAREALEA